jgi:predicted nucleotidyltransferase
MRLSENEIVIIKKLTVEIFGQGSKVYLFGSRVNDQLKGGDIDLFISNTEKYKLSLLSKVNFLAELKCIIGDQKIDVVMDTETTRSKRAFYSSVIENAIQL